MLFAIQFPYTCILPMVYVVSDNLFKCVYVPKINDWFFEIWNMIFIPKISGNVMMLLKSVQTWWFYDRVEYNGISSENAEWYTVYIQITCQTAETAPYKIYIKICNRAH